MKNRITIFALLLLPIFAAGTFKQEQTLFGQDGDKKVEAKTIALESVYSTNEQKGLKTVRRGGDLDEIYRHTQGLGASNVFLVRAKDFSEALSGTRSVFTGFAPAHVPPGPRETKDFWLVTYFGVAGSGNAWVIKSVEKKGKTTFRLTYEVGQSENADAHQYFAWLPLGALEPGSYTLELFDAKEKEVYLMRRVNIGK